MGGSGDVGGGGGGGLERASDPAAWYDPEGFVISRELGACTAGEAGTARQAVSDGFGAGLGAAGSAESSVQAAKNTSNNTPLAAKGPRWCVLPPSLYPNGLAYLQKRIPQAAGAAPHAMLADWLPAEQVRRRHC